MASKLGLTESVAVDGIKEPTFLPKGFIQFDLVVTINSGASGTKIMDLNLPVGVIIASLYRDGLFITPDGKTQLRENDIIMALGRESNIRTLQEIFGNDSIKNQRKYL